jgi:uncharacterized Zn-binding protein involved in type VI secretion
VLDCQYTYYKAGTFTVTVKLRDKNNYAKGYLAVGSWQVTVVEEGQEGPVADSSAKQVDAGEEEPDEKVRLELTHPAGKSPKVFTSGWLFGAKCVVVGDDEVETDVSETVRWSGSGVFRPEAGSRCRPTFSAAGANTIKLTVEVDGKPVTKTFDVVAVSPRLYACVGGKAFCPNDSHGCIACPHPVIGPIQTGSSLVLIDGKPAARVGDRGVHAACCGPNTFEIASADSPTHGPSEVVIEGQFAAKLGCMTKHCGGVGRIVDTGHGLSIPRGSR